jgi:ubiquinone/menaquinone biosynthesis C-methylase UbiE
MKKEISRVLRSKEEARTYYNRLSRYYDWLGGVFERAPAMKALSCLNIQNGESALEIGFGTGFCLQQIAVSVGHSGRTCGIDISDAMLRTAVKRLNRTGLGDRVELFRADAVEPPFEAEAFDVVFICFTLELFDSPDIPLVLNGIKRVLKPGGRLGIVSLSKNNPDAVPVRVYEWIHRLWPKYADCRPIYLAESVQKAGYKIAVRETSRLVVLPIETVIAVK